ncbi:MAG: helix-turn-helix transcriptional regulator [Verrucomicrobiota bacterium]
MTCHGDSEELLAPIVLTHPGNPGLQASIGLIRPRDLCLAQPLFLVQFVKTAENETPVLDFSPVGMLRLQGLTVSEREVALAAVQGHSNYEIALKFGKAESTVKAQLFSTFQKLGIQRRSQLAALLK